MKVCTCRRRLTVNAMCQVLRPSGRWKYVHVDSDTVNAICQVLQPSGRWKYVHVDADWQWTPCVRYCDFLVGESMYMSTPTDSERHLSGTTNFWLVKACTCRCRLTMNAICQTLRASCRWKHVHVGADSQWTPSVRHYDLLVGESMYMSTPTDNERHLSDTTTF